MAFKAARKLFRDFFRLPNRLKSYVWQEQENVQTVLYHECGLRPLIDCVGKSIQSCQIHSQKHSNFKQYVNWISKLFWQNLSYNRCFASSLTRLQQLNRTSVLFGAVGLAYYESTTNSQCKLSVTDALMCIQKISQKDFKEKEFAVNKIPASLKEFSLKQRIGEQSSSAAVYAAEYKDQEYAIKIMFNYEHASNEYALKKGFFRECRVLTTIKNEEANNDPSLAEVLPEHPNVIKVLNVLVEETPCPVDAQESYPVALPRHLNINGLGRNKTLCLVMPKYSCTLREYLRHHNPSLKERMLLFAQLLEGVAHLVENDEAHRDLKADNILLDMATGGCPKLVITDFGCCLGDKSLRLKLPFESDHVDRGGNSAMMAPEVAAAVPLPGAYIDYSKADLWACGAIAFEIFGLRNPFTDRRLESRNYRDEEIQCFLQNDGMVENFIAILLRRDPNERPSAAEAAIFAGLLLYAPKKWFKLEEFDEEISNWLFAFWLRHLRNARRSLHQRSEWPTDMTFQRCFLQRATPEAIEHALERFKTVFKN